MYLLWATHQRGGISYYTGLYAPFACAAMEASTISAVLDRIATALENGVDVQKRIVAVLEEMAAGSTK